MSNRIITTVKKELKQRRWAILAYCAFSVFFVWIYTAVYPSIQKQSEEFNELFESYPEGFLQAFGIEQLQIDTLEGFIAAEHFSFIWQLLIILLLVSTVGRTIAGEIEKGTISLMLVLPLTRMRTYLAKYMAAVFILVLFCIVSIFSVPVLAWVYSLKADIGAYALTLVIGLAFSWAVLGLSFMISSMVSEKAKLYFAIGGLLFVMYVANVVANLSESFDYLRYVSLFNYFEPLGALTNREISFTHITVMVLVALVSSLIGLWQFKRRDISV